MKFGIDLGTTNSVIAYLKDDETPKIIRNNRDQSETTESIVFYPLDGTDVIVGNQARQCIIGDEEALRFIDFVKTKMGETDCVREIDGRKVSPEEVSAYILKYMKQFAEQDAIVNAGEVKDVVVTVPAYFGQAEIAATKLAAEKAGLNVLKIINEPEAAAIYYVKEGNYNAKNKKGVIVYDLGGGTFDVTLLTIENDGKTINMIHHDGDKDLGGKDWDDKLSEIFLNKYKSQTGFSEELSPVTKVEFHEITERAKKQLTVRENVQAMLNLNGSGRANISVTRKEFEEATADLLNKSFDIMQKTYEIAAKNGIGIDEILLVGGSTKMPQVQTGLDDRFNVTARMLDPDLAVAKGAAIKANMEEPPEDFIECKKCGYKGKSEEFADGKCPKCGELIEIEINPISIKSYAVEVTDNGVQKLYNILTKDERLVKNGSGEFILKHSDNFKTNYPNQQIVNIKIYESEYIDENIKNKGVYDISQGNLLQTVTLNLGGGLPINSPIEIVFEINSQGILNVYGIDKTNNKEIHQTIERVGSVVNPDSIQLGNVQS